MWSQGNPNTFTAGRANQLGRRPVSCTTAGQWAAPAPAGRKAPVSCTTAGQWAAPASAGGKAPVSCTTAGQWAAPALAGAAGRISSASAGCRYRIPVKNVRSIMMITAYVGRVKRGVAGPDCPLSVPPGEGGLRGVPTGRSGGGRGRGDHKGHPYGWAAWERPTSMVVGGDDSRAGAFRGRGHRGYPKFSLGCTILNGRRRKAPCVQA